MNEKRKAEHTPGPWKSTFGGHRVISEHSSVDTLAICVNYGEESAANAALIVACVNALEGLNPEAVKALVEAAKRAEQWSHGTIHENDPVFEELYGELDKLHE